MKSGHNLWAIEENMGTNLQAVYSSSLAENTKTAIICITTFFFKAGSYVNRAGEAQNSW